MANPTMTLIASNTVGSGGAATVTFSSIPATYTDLVLLISERASVTDTYGDYSDFITLFLNSDTSASYSTITLRGNTSAVSYSNINNTSGQGGLGNGPLTTANSFGNTEIYFPNYASSRNKSLSINGTSESNISSSFLHQVLQAGLWANTNAITSISLNSLGGGAGFTQYSTFYLYGIKNS